MLFSNLLQNRVNLSKQCQTSWIQIMLDVLLGLVWVQSVCKGYEQTTLGDKS